MRNSEWRVANAEWRMRSAELKFRNPNSQFRIPKSEIRNWVVMDNRDLKERTKKFALKVIKVVEMLPQGRTADIIGRQLIILHPAASAAVPYFCHSGLSRIFLVIPNKSEGFPTSGNDTENKYSISDALRSLPQGIHESRHGIKK